MAEDKQDDLDKMIQELGLELDMPEVKNYDQSSFPTEMSCMQVFNEVVDCYSIGGQARHVYRYGTLNTCWDTRDKFKFCLFTKLAAKDEQKRKIARYYMERLARQKLERGTSEDVWSVRTEKLEQPFGNDQD